MIGMLCLGLGLGFMLGIPAGMAMAIHFKMRW